MEDCFIDPRLLSPSRQKPREKMDGVTRGHSQRQQISSSLTNTSWDVALFFKKPLLSIAFILCKKKKKKVDLNILIFILFFLVQ